MNVERRWQWPPFMPSFAARSALLVLFIACAILIGIFAPWWGMIPVVLLAAYQAFWVVMLVVRRTQGRLPPARPEN